MEGGLLGIHHMPGAEFGILNALPSLVPYKNL